MDEVVAPRTGNDLRIDIDHGSSYCRREAGRKMGLEGCHWISTPNGRDPGVGPVLGDPKLTASLAKTPDIGQNITGSSKRPAYTQENRLNG
jgi:hypothetical protein